MEKIHIDKVINKFKKFSSELINEKEVEELFDSCLSKRKSKNAIENIEIELIDHSWIFNVDKLWINRNKIINILDNISSDINVGLLDVGFSVDKNSYLWTKNELTAYKLIALGIAINELEYVASTEIIKELFLGTAYLRRKNKAKIYKFMALCEDEKGEKRLLFNSSSDREQCKYSLEFFIGKLKYIILEIIEVSF